MRIQGGRTVYGQELGILMLDTVSPRPPGDVGHAATWPFPVRYYVVRGAVTSRIMGETPDPDLLAPFLEGARALEGTGVRAITTSCGFLAIFHAELQASVRVPVLTSALLQVPLAAQLVGPDRTVAILTERPHLTERHFRGVGWSAADIAVRVVALGDDAVFPRVFIDETAAADQEVLEAELVALAVRAAADDVGALVLECTNFVPYAAAMRRATGLPIFDLYTLVLHTHEALEGTRFPRVSPPGVGRP